MVLFGRRARYFGSRGQFVGRRTCRTPSRLVSPPAVGGAVATRAFWQLLWPIRGDKIPLGANLRAGPSTAPHGAAERSLGQPAGTPAYGGARAEQPTSCSSADAAISSCAYALGDVPSHRPAVV
ncbi:unnamed protein product [Amoebophrya sp. A120]|nr:unnamed protein product [Amoebophrya sp. A120]|eukprot:GSA120T00018726001.1